MAKRILMVLSNEYRPDPRVRKEAHALISGGHEVTVISWNRLKARPKDEEDAGIRVTRVATGTVNNIFGLVINYPIFVLKAFLEGRRARPDAVHCHDFDTLFIGVLLSKYLRVPLVYDSHEHYSRMVAEDVPEAAVKVIDRLESRMLRCTGEAVAANENVARHLREQGASHVTIVLNCIELPAPSEMHTHESTELVLFYAGALEPGRYVVESIDIVKEMKACTLIIAGAGRLEPSVKAAAAGHQNIEFLGYRPQSEILERMRRTDVVLSVLDPSNENFQIGTPTKMCEAMAYAIPVIVTKGTFGAEIATTMQCGLAIDYDEGSFKEALTALRDPKVRNEMGRNGRKAAEREFNWGLMRERLLDIYSRL